MHELRRVHKYDYELVALEGACIRDSYKLVRQSVVIVTSINQSINQKRIRVTKVTNVLERFEADFYMATFPDTIFIYSGVHVM